MISLGEHFQSTAEAELFEFIGESKGIDFSPKLCFKGSTIPQAAIDQGVLEFDQIADLRSGGRIAFERSPDNTITRVKCSLFVQV